MSDDEAFEIELPDWVSVLLRAAQEKGYKEGWEEGQKAFWYNLQRKLEMVKPYGA